MGFSLKGDLHLMLGWLLCVHVAGALDEGVPICMSYVYFKKLQCRMSLLLIFLMSPVESKRRLYPLSLSFQSCHMSLGLMSPVESKKWPCHSVDFRGVDPSCCRVASWFTLGSMIRGLLHARSHAQLCAN